MYLHGLNMSVNNQLNKHVRKTIENKIENQDLEGLAYREGYPL